MIYTLHLMIASHSLKIITFICLIALSCDTLSVQIVSRPIQSTYNMYGRLNSFIIQFKPLD
jgi:hypothetical protein